MRYSTDRSPKIPGHDPRVAAEQRLTPAQDPAAWVPADTCTLPTAEHPLRVAEFAALFAAGLRDVHRVSDTWLRLHLDRLVTSEHRVRELTARESACCTFFEFAVGTGVEGLLLDVRVPAPRVGVLDGLERQASAHHRAA